MQISYFRDSDPKGFGLVQRERQFDAYQDLEAHYQDRPSAWVEPAGNWGDGCVQLVEIPTETEYFDNIVAYWRPDKSPARRAGHTRSAIASAGAMTLPPRRAIEWGRPVSAKARDRGPFALLSISWTCGAPSWSKSHLSAHRRALAAVAGSCDRRQLRPSSAPLVQRNPEFGGIRATFEFDPQNRKESELRLALVDQWRTDLGDLALPLAPIVSMARLGC